MPTPQRFSTQLISGTRNRVFVPVPFDPDEPWGRPGVAPGLWSRRRRRRRSSARAGGPQRDDLAADVAAALADNPQAGEFFDSLAQFYRRAYLRYIDATKRRPDERAARIAEVVGLLGAGIKQRPGT